MSKQAESHATESDEPPEGGAEDASPRSAPFNKPLVVLVATVWLALLVNELFTWSNSSGISILLWVFAAYVLRYLLRRFHSRPASLGAARIDSNTPIVVRGLVDLAALVFVGWSAVQLLASS